MKIVIPKAITVINTNLTDAAPIYDITKAYSKDSIVRQTDTHHKYQALADVAAGIKPSDNYAIVQPKWSDLGVSNDWACFDDAIKTSAVCSSDDGTIQFTFDSSRCDTVYLFNLSNASSVRFELYDVSNAAILSNATFLANATISNWYEYFYEDFLYERTTSRAFPIYGSSKLKVKIFGVGSNKPSVGTIIVGKSAYIGRTKWGPELGYIDWSTDEEDKWGTATLVQGPVSDKFTGDVYIETASLDRVDRLFKSVRGKLAVYDFNNEKQDMAQATFEASIVLGRTKDFKITAEGLSVSTITVEVRGIP